MVENKFSQQLGISFFSPGMFLVFAFFFLPIALPSLFLWVTLFQAVPVFFLFRLAATERQAVVQLRNGLLLAGAGALLFQEVGMFVASFVLLPLGYSLHRSLERNESPAVSGQTGILILGLSWLASWLIYGLATGVNPYTSLLGLMDTTFEQLIAQLELYRTRTELQEEARYNLGLAVHALSGARTHLLPKIFPGMLAGTAVITVWLNMVAGNYFLYRFQPDRAAWPAFRYWQLPDKLIWLLITAGTLSLIASGGVQNIGYCLAIITGLLYFFQGLAIFIHLLSRWNVPVFWKIILYIIMAQSYGLFLLALAGIADTWADFRKLRQEEQASC